MKRILIVILSCLTISSIILLFELHLGHQGSSLPNKSVITSQNNIPLPEESYIKSIVNKYKDKKPTQWGEKVSGVKTRLNTNDKVIALTFDACGGKHGGGYDKKLIDYLIKENVPATLFINYRWIESNYDTFMNLSKNPLFEIENHGYAHKPLSVNGKSAYGIQGTQNIQEVILEVLRNTRRIQELTGRKPKYFRPGTAYSDEVAASIVKDLGEEEVSFSVLGDAGATFSKEQIRRSCLSATPGSIIICHMNHPEVFNIYNIFMKKVGNRFETHKEYINFFLIFLLGFSVITKSNNIDEQYLKLTSISNNGKIIYLTFDDGPSSAVTNDILDVLKEQKVKATFFVIGNRIKGREAIIRRMYKEGHSIGLHTYSHEYNYKFMPVMIHLLEK